MTGRAMFALMLAALIAIPAWVGAQAPDEGVELGQSSALVGQQVAMTIRIATDSDSTVELTPGTESWNGIELVRTERPVSMEVDGGLLWTIEAVVTGFFPGETEFAPTVAIVTGTDVRARTLQPVRLTVASVLAPDAPLVLRPLAPPVAIAGGESPWLRPGVAAGLAGVVLITLAIMLVLWRLLRRSLRRGSAPMPVLAIADEAGLETAERVIETDPVAAYRLMSSVVKTELAKRYGLRATALTTNELRGRLERAGADRWEARLVGGLLEECDAVIYAGYRPALERRAADLTMAREIVEVS